MQSFVVSARKYRPSSWEDVIGQDQVVGTLKNAIKNEHLAQSFLFCGPRGVGKTTCARILAKTINCENLQPDGEACNTCESCNSFNENASFNIHEIDAASNNSVEDIRSLVDQVRYAPASGKYKIYIVDEVHMLSSQAFNAFLKTLEEPPAYVKFILATTEKHKIIPTILSRCQIFDFNRIRIRDMVKQLESICKKEHVDAEAEALHLIAQKADGAMRDALSIYDRIISFSGNAIKASDVIENLNILDYEYYFRMTDAFLAEDVTAALLLYDEVVNKGFEGDTFINGLAEHCRNVLVCNDEQTLQLLDTSENVIERYKQQAGKISPSFLLSALNVLNTADIQYRISKNKRLHVELAIMKLCYMQHAISSGQLSGTEKKTTELNKIVQPEQKKVPLTRSEDKKMPEILPEKNGQKQDEKQALETVEVAEKSTVAKVEIRKKAEDNGNVETVAMPVKSDLRTIIRKAEDEKAEREKREAEAAAADTASISPELFFIAWKQYADLIRADHQRVAIIMDHAEVTIGKDNKIDVKLEASVEVNILKEMLNEMRAFLSESLETNNFEIAFVVETTKQERNKRPYTTQEKYKKMEENNPVIKELKNALGFELDY
ncbi:MAG: DNA polymerase III subunit gamma/tau [Chitinophagales bacterium]